MFSNECAIAEIGVDAAENEPLDVGSVPRNQKQAEWDTAHSRQRSNSSASCGMPSNNGHEFSFLPRKVTTNPRDDVSEPYRSIRGSQLK